MHGDRMILKELKVPVEYHNYKFRDQGCFKVRKDRGELSQYGVWKNSVKPSGQC